tara:strand:- start:353 stop:640 length:288 start_codon:yes stop_codon:yes gene_type:complete
MFKSFLKKNYKKRDIRFLDAESYKFQQVKKASPPTHNVDDETIQEEEVNLLSSVDEPESSDSKTYSALIHTVLSKYDLDIQHFNHPETFKRHKYP